MDSQKEEVYEFLKRIDMLQYHDAFCREGFECIESIADIQESDFEVLGVKRGHRRFIQRRALEIINPVRYSRDLPPITSPIPAAQQVHQTSLEHHGPSLSLEETEPLTAYLHRPHPQHLIIQKGPYNSPGEQRLQQLQPQPQHVSPGPAQQYSPVYPSYLRNYSPHHRHQHQAPTMSVEQPQRNISQQQSIHPTSPFSPRQTIPFPMPAAEATVGQPPSMHTDSPAPGASTSSARPQPKPLQPPAQHKQQQQSSDQPSLPVASPTKPARRSIHGVTKVPHVTTYVSPEQMAFTQQHHSHPHSRQQQPQSTSYSHQPTSASTDASSPRRQHTSPTSPFSGPYQQQQQQHSIPSIANVIRIPSMRQRTRGQSMASNTSAGTTAQAAASSNRRRSSRADPRSPYSRPTAIPQSPHSPPSPQSPTSPQSPRRTYRRHPKKDPNAPEKWRSAYQLFRDDVNRELHGQDIPFSEMSKIHSKRWAELSPEMSEMYYQRSKSDKEEYLRKMAVYEQTLEYKQYEEYLEKFFKQDSTVNRVGRPKGTRSSSSKGKGTSVGPSTMHARSQSTGRSSGSKQRDESMSPQSSPVLQLSKDPTPQ
ncbi:hypothetical protein EDC05_002006 [Coemansia umbellata]|nr:hypothetical protein EDC05_002006 [Coemansia umbellata]